MKKKFLILIPLLLTVSILYGSFFEKVQATREIALVLTTEGLGDNSYNDAAYAGIKKAKEKFDINFDVAEPDEIEDYKTYIRQLARSKKYDLILSIGFEQTRALKNIASSFPDQKFVLIDMIVNKPNVTSYVFSEEERGFLMGVAAAMMTVRTENKHINEKKLIGVISGMKIPLIEANIAGFISGARYIDKEVKVEYSFAGDWIDSRKGKEIALTLIDKGADIIWHTGGEFGLGVIEAARERNCYAIGSDFDQSYIAPDTVLTSGMKFIDNTVYRAVKNFLDDHFQSNIHVLGIKEKALGYTSGLLPHDIIKKLEKIKQKIINGKIEIPTKIKKAK